MAKKKAHIQDLVIYRNIKKNRIKMTFTNIKFEVSDPVFYDPLISSQKQEVGEDPENAEKWLKLGRLQEAKVEMTKWFAQKSLFMRWWFVVILLYASLITTILYHNPSLLSGLYFWTFTLPSIFAVLVCLIFTMWLRYPHSGKRYFRKALLLNPECADTYMYLGRIALRRHQKIKGFLLLEKAFAKGGCKKNDRELKALYVKEFSAIINKKTDKEKKLQKHVDQLQDETLRLKIENASLKNRNTSVTKKKQNIRLAASRAMKHSKNDMRTQIEKIRYDYEKKIADLKLVMELDKDAREEALNKVSDLTLEILEAKATCEKQSFNQAAKNVEQILGPNTWQTLYDKTRSCLATAEHAFLMLDRNSKDTDFSLVGMELCKALETEINYKLVYPFSKRLLGCSDEFLKINRTCDSKGIPAYFTYLAKVVDNANYPDVTKLSLGQFLFVLQKTHDSDLALDEYGNFLDYITKDSGTSVGKIFREKLRVVTTKYRNSITHHSHMDVKQCEHLRELIFE